MPFAVGISLISLQTGSPVTVHIMPTTSDSDATTSSGKTLTQPILDASDLSSTFAAIAAAIPEETVQATLAVPSYIAEPARKPIVRAAHKIRIFRKIWVADNIQLVKRQLDLDLGTPTRNELFIEISPDLAFARLDHTEVEEDIRSADTLKQVFVSLPPSSVDSVLLAALLDPIDVELRTSPTPSGSDVKNIVITGGEEALITALSEKIKNTFVGGKIIIIPNEYAKYAAQYSCVKYQDFLNMDQMFITNVVPLRVGIAKADGFVITALQRNSTLPQNRSLLLTTSMDNQTTATVTIVVGISPVSKDNTPIAKLVLENLVARPRGETIIKVSFDVEQTGETTITAEELGEDGTNAAGARASIELENVLGNDLFSDDVEDALEGLASLSGNPAAVEAEDRWAGERAQGDLPK